MYMADSLHMVVALLHHCNNVFVEIQTLIKHDIQYFHHVGNKKINAGERDR